MGEQTKISWTDHTFNIWWGCEHAPAEPGASPDEISEECRNCYADVDIEVAENGIGGEECIPIPRAGGLGRIHLLIVGDESGHRRRPAQAVWVRTARDAADRHGVAFHLKQLHIPEAVGDRGKDGVVHLPIFDGRRHDDMPRGPA